MALIYALDDAMQATLSDAAKFDRLAARLGAKSCRGQGPTAQALRSRSRQGARVSHPVLVAPTPVGTVTHGCHRHDRQPPGGRPPRHSRELVHADRTDQAAVPLECSAGTVDAVARRAAGSDRPQSDRDHGRVHAHRSAVQDPRRRAVPIARRDPRTAAGREPIARVWRPRHGRKTCSARSTARRPRPARRCS